MENNEIQCCLAEKCSAEHSKCSNNIYTEKLYQVGVLFSGQPVCCWCLLHLQEMTKVPLNDNDLHLEDLKIKFPGYWKVINTEGFDKVGKEINRTWLEIEPDAPEKAKPTIINHISQRDRTWK
jgi:hypothetical protein